MKRSDITDELVVTACSLFHNRCPGSSTPLEILSIYYPWKVALAAMDRAFGRDLIDYGTSLGTAWPTEKGLKLLDPVTK